MYRAYLKLCYHTDTINVLEATVTKDTVDTMAPYNHMESWT